MDAGVIGILIAHLGTFGSGELKIKVTFLQILHFHTCIRPLGLGSLP